MKSFKYKVTSVNLAIEANENESIIIEDILNDFGDNNLAIDSIESVDYWDGLCNVSIYFEENYQENPNQIVENLMNYIGNKFLKFSNDNLYALIGKKVRIIGGKYDNFEGILAICPSYVEDSKEKMLLFDKSIYGDDRVSVLIINNIPFVELIN